MGSAISYERACQPYKRLRSKAPNSARSAGDVQRTMPPIELAKRLALLLVLAFFLGLAFEEVYKRDEPTIPGGIRTFPLVGLAGAMLYLVEPHWALAFVAGLLAMAAWLSAGAARRCLLVDGN